MTFFDLFFHGPPSNQARSGPFYRYMIKTPDCVQFLKFL